MRQQREPDGGEKPADIRCGTVIRDLAAAQQQDLAETVEHPGTGLMHCYHDALALLLGIFLQS